MLTSWLEWTKTMFVLEFGKPSMPAPAPVPKDPSKDPAAIAAQQQAERDAEVATSRGAMANMVAGQKMAEDEEQKNRAARNKLGYGS